MATSQVTPTTAEEPAVSVTTLPGDWLSQSETALALGKSPKTIEAMGYAKQIATTLVARAGRKPERVYSRADVDRLAKEQEDRKSAPRSQVPAAAAPKENVIALAPKAVSTLEQLIDRLNAPRQVPLEVKLWLTVKEAARYSGLPKSFVGELIEQGKLQVIERPYGRGIARLISRKSLEAFEG